MTYTIKAETIFLENRILKNSAIVVEDGVIRSVDGSGESGQVIDLGPLTLVPGFIDIHTHGGGGHDVMDGTFEALNALSLFKLEEGVTGFCPTIITESFEKIENAVTAVRDAMTKGVEGARVLGSFLEGPYVNPRFKGAHAEEHLRPVDLGEIRRLIELGQGSIRSFAIAPELPGAMAAITLLRENGIDARLGHSAATYEEALSAAGRGASAGVHTFNAMSPVNHREPGLAGAILDSPALFGELICDLVHVHPAAIRMLLKCKGRGRVALVTDSTRASGLPDGEYSLGGQAVRVQGGVCRLENGALAGSTLRMNQAVKNMASIGASLYDAVYMASQTPAAALGLTRRAGGIAPGKKAELAGLDELCGVRFVMWEAGYRML